MFRHVAKTGDIKNFVIVEESGIEKGIRRIIAVTGHEAAEVTRQAKTLTATLEQIEKTTGKDKDQMLKTFQVVCDVTVTSQLMSYRFHCRNSARRIFRC